MKILSSDKKIASALTNCVLVTSRSIKKYDGDEQVSIIIGTRNLIRIAEYLHFTNLKFVQLLSAGYESIDIEKYRNRGVMVSNAGNIYGVGMAEYVVYAMLMSAKRYNKSIRSSRIRLQRGYNWITELAGKTVGILGCGAIGSQVAKRLSGFDMTILGYDLLLDKKPYFDKVYTTEHINEFLPKCDYLVISIPLTNQTEGRINKSLFDLMKPNVVIINVGRQGLFNKRDFIAALKSNREMSAVLDMFELVPNPITNPFRRLSNVKVFPGVSAISKEINQKKINLVIENVRRVMQNQPPKFLL